MSNRLIKYLRVFLKRTLGRKWLSHRTIFAKAVIYRCYAVLGTFLMSFAVTGNVDLSLGISMMDLIGKTTLYFFFEKGWDEIRRGASL